MVNFFDDRYEDNGFVIKYRRDFLLDTDEDLSDLPPADVIRAGSLAYSIGSGSLYILNGSGEWVKTKTAGGGGDDPEPEQYFWVEPGEVNFSEGSSSVALQAHENAEGPGIPEGARYHWTVDGDLEDGSYVKVSAMYGDSVTVDMIDKGPTITIICELETADEKVLQTVTIPVIF